MDSSPKGRRPLRKQRSALFLGRRAERFSAEPLFREAKWNPCLSAITNYVPTWDVFSFQRPLHGFEPATTLLFALLLGVGFAVAVLRFGSLPVRGFFAAEVAGFFATLAYGLKLGG